MSSAQDPFYIVKEEIQESIDKLQFTFHRWENIPANGEDHAHLTKELIGTCDSIEWQVDELEKTISVAARDPAWFGISEVELGKRRRWTSIARTQVGNVKKVVGGKDLNGKSISNKMGERQELMRVPHSQQQDRTDQYIAGENDDFISSESDRQMLLIKQQDEELDEMSVSIQRIGDVGLTIHDELLAQDQIIDELGMEMESTSNRLDFVQKKVGMVMKKAVTISTASPSPSPSPTLTPCVRSEKSLAFKNSQQSVSSRRDVGLRLVGTVFGFGLIRNADAAARRPPPTPPSEKKDPTIINHLLKDSSPIDIKLNTRTPTSRVIYAKITNNVKSCEIQYSSQQCASFLRLIIMMSSLMIFIKLVALAFMLYLQRPSQHDIWMLDARIIAL
ncbi:hypothetical protein OSB04_010232 [Centaurea solstitialis]|uniref:t-SNARE coiled-coil homology domain-containing protein n=1 Tax=Centaurea solstitialis TaxID=347529 RepID=A0AA38TEQ5_9ASTR|nr:hypothetical protein OSB04_010232 [Centaurea solstitialis]